MAEATVDEQQRDDVQDRQQGLQSGALYAITRLLSRQSPDDPLMQEARTLVNALNPGVYTFGAPPPAPAPTPTPARIVYALDVSSNQGLDIGALLDQHKPDHLIAKLYQRVELGGNGARFSIAHAQQARNRAMTQGGYGWLYDFDGARQVGDFLATAEQAGIELGPTNPLWLDCEDYPDSTYPSLDTIRQAVAECDRRGVPCGIYTGAWWWKPRTGNSAEFADRPLWASVYDQQAVMVDVDFGGWTKLAGKQWSGSPVDRSVFHSEYAA